MHLHLRKALSKCGVLAAAATMTAGAGLALTATAANATTGAAASAHTAPASARLTSAAPVSPLAGIFAPITNFGTGKCLQPASAADAAPIIEATCTGSIAQGWETKHVSLDDYMFINQATGECFDAFDGAFNGARLLQGTCKAISNEQFNTGTPLPATAKIEDRAGFKDTGFCLDVSSDQTNVLFFMCNGSMSQTWSMPAPVQ